MDIYVLKGLESDKFCKLCESISVIGSEEQFKKLGFKNYYPKYLYKSYSLFKDYDVSFCIAINKKDMTIHYFMIIDNNFRQPSFCNKENFKFIRNKINDLVKAGLFKYNDK